jgi:Brp/Blh family beta-carotene 15,15'-monooxygenase
MNKTFKRNYQNFMLFFTFFLFWFSIQFGGLVEDSVAFVLIVSLGILHGANDLLILSKGHKSKTIFFKHLIIYIAIIVGCILIYFFSSILAILLFVLLSSYHFGEEHLGEKITVNSLFNVFFYMFYGVFIFSMLFYVSIADVDHIMRELTDATFTEFQIEISLGVSLSVLSIMSLYLVFKKSLDIKMLLTEIFYLGLLFLVFKTSSLILSFAIYFILWHSIPSIINQVEFVYGDLTKESMISYVKKALIYWIISILGMLVIYQLIPQVSLFSTIIFVVLFAVTAPHTWVMYKMKS